MGKSCSGGASDPQGRMAELLRPDGGTPNATPATLRQLKREISEKKWVEAR